MPGSWRRAVSRYRRSPFTWGLGCWRSGQRFWRLSRTRPSPVHRRSSRRGRRRFPAPGWAFAVGIAGIHGWRLPFYWRSAWWLRLRRWSRGRRLTCSQRSLAANWIWSCSIGSISANRLPTRRSGGHWWLRRVTRAPVFSLMFATYAALLCLATLLRFGMLDWLDHDPGRFYFHLLPCALLFLVAGFVFERLRLPDDSRYFYPFAVAFTWAALSGVAAFHQPYADWLKSVAPWTRGQPEYLFIGNAAIYFTLDWLSRLQSSPLLRLVGHAFRFVIPGHVMTSLLLLGLNAESPAESRIFSWMLPSVAAVFVFASIPRQMKNYLASGLLFLAIGVYRLQRHEFPGRAFWPIVLLVSGIALMLIAGNYAPLKVTLVRWWRKLGWRPI